VMRRKAKRVRKGQAQERKKEGKPAYFGAHIEWANFSDCGFSRRVFLFRQEVSFSQSYSFFPSFCQALAEDRVTTPTKKKKK